jgi:trehalose/maltose hydrolase-like predicted phosphorylase
MTESPTGHSDLEPEDVDEWILSYGRFDPEHEGLREALCTLGNGSFATRGAAPEAVADGVHYPGTYVAGLYDRRSMVIAGRSVENESIVNLPNWLVMDFRFEDGPWFDAGALEVLEHRQDLDLRQATLSRTLRVRDGAGRVTQVEQRRFVSMSDSHVAGLETVIRAENWSGRLTVRSGLDGRIVNAGVGRYRQFDDGHLDGVQVDAIDDETIALSARTSQSKVRIAEAARTRIARDGTSVVPLRRVVEEPGFIAHELTMDIAPSQAIIVEKVVTLFTSKDRSISEPWVDACAWVGRVGSFDDLLNSHVRDWDHLWNRFSLELKDGSGLTLLTLRLHIFHLLQTTSRNTLDLDVGVPARGLHGEAYRGHVFWDELFIFPYLNLHLPELVRSLLLYRYRRLPEARWAAREAGFRGAMFPWQSGSSGREESQVVHLNPLSGDWMPDASHLQRHINAAIAYNVWGHYQATGDIDFMATYGAEMIFEICRFWASVATYDEELDRYEILGVMGPDEYHDGYPGATKPGLDNNAYTNIMAVWVLGRGLELIEFLPEPRRSELREKLSIDDSELARWDEITHKMRLIFHSDRVISQFEGYEQLAELDWTTYRTRYGDISRLDRILENEHDSPNAYKASKQADVLMLFYLFSTEELGAIFDRLGYAFEPDSVPRTIDYYLQRTSHGSTLSKVVHAWVLSRSDREQSWKFFEDALRSDLDDSQGGTTAEGVHLGAMAGSVDLLQRCYLGIETRDDVLWLNPLLPPEVQSLTLDVRYRRRWLNLAVAKGELTVEAQDWGEGTVRVGLGGDVVELHPGELRRLAL